MRKLPMLLVAIGALIALCACGHGRAPARRIPPPTTRSAATTPAALPLPPASLNCADAIARLDAPDAALSVVLGRVALPLSSVLQANPSGEAGAARLFAKVGLVIRAGASFELEVPHAWSGRLSIGWGNPGKRSRHLVVAGCRSAAADERWLAYAGGYWIDRPACVPLLVRAAGREEVVHIGVGTACPGQERPG